MDILKDRTIWIAIVVLTLGGLYYWVIVDQSRVDEMNNLESSDYELTGDVTEWSEAYKRLELKWKGTSKHVRTLQDETHAHYERYAEKMDSIDTAFDRVRLDIEQLEERLIQKLDRLSDDIRNLADSFDSYKRTTNRTIREFRQDISTMKDDLLAVDKELHPEKYEEKKKE